MRPVDLALDVALIVMRNGGSTSMADRTFRSVLQGCGQAGVSAVWRLDLVAAFGASDVGESAILRPVGTVGVHLTRVSEATILGERVARGEVDPAAIPAEVARINALGTPHGAWGMVAIAACTGACFSRIAGGDWGAFAIAFAAAGLGQVLRTRLQASRLPVAATTLLSGVLSACLAAVGLRLGWSQTAAASAIASVMYMVPGLPLINGFLDAISQKHLLVGLDRIAYAAYVFTVLVIAIAFAQAVL
jgi:uncharacterized membrane protein YjjP (DUF1212 family)